MTTYHFVVPGDPKGQPRVRAFFNKHTGRAGVYTPGTAEHWKGEIARAAKEAGLSGLGFRGTVGLKCVYYFKHPASHYRTGKNSRLLREGAPHVFHSQRPDTDNIRKAIKDTLKTIGAFYDDAQVCYDLDLSLWSESPSCTEVTVMLDLKNIP